MLFRNGIKNSTGINQTTHTGKVKYFTARVTAIKNSAAENILKTILATPTGNNKKGAKTMDVKGGKGVYDTKIFEYPFCAINAVRA